ncbi:hypothetical protein FGG08_003837 [Glutinoglossum americanum]|uniref:Uncharacterized protein n=1 Tax=Glutinoglossum americanum TaxID=1670608 RepID=A0A9P8KXN4_9PEZI|nr:hypothetical protein FGG08_003837 [Glutinoglossum americanum]
MTRPKRGLSEADANTRVKAARTGKAEKTETNTAAVKKVVTKETKIEKTPAGKKIATGKKGASETKATTRSKPKADKTRTDTGEKAAAEKNAPAKKTSTEKTGRNRTDKTAGAAESSGKDRGSAKKVTSTRAAASKPKESGKATNPTTEWITYCHPSWDRGPDDDSSGDENEDEDEDEDGSPHSPNCKCKKPLSENPDWPWVVSKDGFALALKWQKEQMKRCQDAFDVYLYNDYNGYGIAEVVDGILAALDRELTKKRVAPMKLWAQLEGMAIFLVTDVNEWFGCDDPDGVDARIRLIGNGLLSALSLLESRNLLNPATTTIKNISMTLALFLTFANDWYEIAEDERGSAAWKTKVVALAKKRGVEIKGPKGIEDIVRGIENEEEDGGEGEQKEESWAEEFSTFKEQHGTAFGPDGRAVKFGGNYYDLTKVPKKELDAMRMGYGY